MDKERDFQGTGWAFPPSFSKAKKSVETVSGQEDIKESLEIILSTRIGERILQPEFGADLSVYIFEAMNVRNQVRIKELIFDAIYMYEPRIRPDEVVMTDMLHDGKILLDIHYTIKSTNSRHNLVYPFYLTEGA
jgi:phage baseplate assembly protein W